MDNVIEIWAPRYSTNSVLIASHKVKAGPNKVVFTKAKHLEGAVYQMDGGKIRSYPTQPNGKGVVHIVPFKDLECVKEPKNGTQ